MPEVEEPIYLDALRGDAKGVWKLVKTDRLSFEDLDRAHDVAFGEEFDDTNDLHLQMAGGVAASKERQAQLIRAAQEAEQAQGRETVAEILGREYSVDPSLVPPEMLDSMWATMKMWGETADSEDAEDHIEHILSQDDDELVLVGPNDEIIAFVNAPHADMERRNILEWVGERLTTAQAKQAGKQAEKDFWISKINKQFDPLINRQTRIISRLEDLYEPVGQAYLDELRLAVENSNAALLAKNPNAKIKALPKSAKVGMLMLQYRVDSARVDVEDMTKAIEYLESIMENPELIREYLVATVADEKRREELMALITANTDLLANMVRTEKKVMKSAIPQAVKLVLSEERKAETGIFFYPGGVPQFSMK